MLPVAINPTIDFDPFAPGALDVTDADREMVRLFREKQAKTRCKRCAGTGWLPRYHYRDAGVCYRCNGSGREK